MSRFNMQLTVQPEDGRGWGSARDDSFPVNHRPSRNEAEILPIPTGQVQPNTGNRSISANSLQHAEDRHNCIDRIDLRRSWIRIFESCVA